MQGLYVQRSTSKHKSCGSLVKSGALSPPKISHTARERHTKKKYGPQTNMDGVQISWHKDKRIHSSLSITTDTQSHA